MDKNKTQTKPKPIYMAQQFAMESKHIDLATVQPYDLVRTIKLAV